MHHWPIWLSLQHLKAETLSGRESPHTVGVPAGKLTFAPDSERPET